MSDQLEQLTTFYPAYDKRDDDPKKNYGIHGVELRMVLVGPEGAVQFVLYTNWHLPHVTSEYRERLKMMVQNDSPMTWLTEPLPADFGVHSRVPLYEGQLPMGAERMDFENTETLHGETGDIEIPMRVTTGTFTPCEYLDGAPCYYDGSTLQAERIYDVLLREGSEGVWAELRAYYEEKFRPLS